MSREERAEGFRNLFDVHYAPLCRFAQSLLDRGAEDVVQEVFVRLWERHRERLPLRDPKAYLFRAVRNTAYNRLDSARARRRDADAEIAAVTESAGPPPDAALAFKQTQADLETALQSLSNRQAEVYRLSRHHGLTYEQIAAVLGVSIKTIETHMGRALAALRAALADRA
jgi:RNA polymerase sigma-70 factor (ECF subfamily)